MAKSKKATSVEVACFSMADDSDQIEVALPENLQREFEKAFPDSPAYPPDSFKRSLGEAIAHYCAQTGENKKNLRFAFFRKIAGLKEFIAGLQLSLEKQRLANQKLVRVNQKLDQKVATLQDQLSAQKMIHDQESEKVQRLIAALQDELAQQQQQQQKKKTIAIETLPGKRSVNKNVKVAVNPSTGTRKIRMS
jgi:hypothetical protein